MSNAPPQRSVPPSIHKRLMENNSNYRELYLRREKARKEGNTLPKGTY
jgi:hypothetical protein